MEIKTMIKDLEVRVTQIQNRMRALNDEMKALNEEANHLIPLLDHYRKLDYDPIEEERRVTAKLIEPKPTHGGGYPKGQFQYRDALNTIFADNKEHSLESIKHELQVLLNRQINKGNFYNIISRAEQIYGLIKRVRTGIYKKA